MTPQECLRAIRLVRFQPLKGRRITMEELGRLTGYSRQALNRVSRRGYVTSTMAKRLSPVLAHLAIERLTETGAVFSGQIASKSSLGRLLDGPDPRGSWARPRRPAGARGHRTDTKYRSIDEKSR